MAKNQPRDIWDTEVDIGFPSAQHMAVVSMTEWSHCLLWPATSNNPPTNTFPRPIPKESQSVPHGSYRKLAVQNSSHSSHLISKTS